jgi:hypothetical protein
MLFLMAITYAASGPLMAMYSRRKKKAVGLSVNKGVVGDEGGPNTSN